MREFTTVQICECCSSAALCLENLADSGLGEEEIEEEAASVSLQKAFVLHKLGKVQEANETYKKIEALK